MPCKLCVERGKTWNGDDPRCAFESGVFSGDNWNCATANELRSIGERNDLIKYGDDASLLVLDVPEGDFDDDHGWNRAWAVLTWYKQRGCTAQAFYMDDDIFYPLKIEQAEAIIEKYGVEA
jgi:hypothetical protein